MAGNEGLMLNIGPAVLPDFLSMAHLYAVLCWPPTLDLAKYEAGVLAIASGALDRALQDEPGRREEFTGTYPEMMAVTPVQRRAVRKGMRIRLRHRMAASRMALGFLEEGLTGLPAKLPRSMTKHTLAALSGLVREDAGIEEPANVAKIWRDAQPVIHLATAFQIILRETFPEVTEARPDMQDADFHRRVIVQASVHDPLVRADRRFGRRRNALIVVRWNE